MAQFTGRLVGRYPSYDPISNPLRLSTHGHTGSTDRSRLLRVENPLAAVHRPKFSTMITIPNTHADTRYTPLYSIEQLLWPLPPTLLAVTAPSAGPRAVHFTLYILTLSLALSSSILSLLNLS